MADTTLQFRHGVLIGNWNEDQFGVQLSRDPNPPLSREMQWTSEMTSKHTNPVNEDTLAQFVEDRIAPRPGYVDKKMLFEHRGDPVDTRHLTSYNEAHSLGQGRTRSVAAPQRLYQKKQAMLRTSGAGAAYQRSSQFRTTAQDQHNDYNSIRSAPPPMRATGTVTEFASFTEGKSREVEIRGRGGRGGQFKGTFDSNHLKIGLRR